MRTALIPLTLLIATGCPFVNDAYVQDHFAALDGDGDGVLPSEGDCDDTNASIHPAATDSCDGIDNDCDGETDEDPQEAFYVDDDGDGFGQGTPMPACPGDGWSGLNTDCDDSNALINPVANEVCNDIDDDCDGTADNTDNSWYADVDGDTFGDFDTASDVCQPGYVSDATDCDDDDSTINPGADELCDGIDQDCSGVPDNDPVDPDTFYLDGDSDGYGDSAATTEACSRPAGYAEVDGDCNDADQDIYPDAEELCDAKDNDCDGETDETPPTWYADADGDGHGDAGVTSQGCDPPSVNGWSAKSDDCNDSNDQIYPLAPERCNDLDDDCDITIDEDAIDQPTWYNDGDSDGYGATSPTQVACDQPSGYVDNSDDCNDGEADVNPDTVWYADTDNDQFGDPSGATMTQCVQPTGFVRDATDCNDADGSQNPATVWYPDTDGDDYGEMGGTTMVQCAQPAAHVMDNTDCNDGDPAINPESIWFTDGDGDGFGDENDAGTQQCAKPNSTDVLNDTDCDDSDGLTFPGQAETCDPVDRNCDLLQDDDHDLDSYLRPGCGGVDCDDESDATTPTPGGGCTLYNDCTELQTAQAGLGFSVDDGDYWFTLDSTGGDVQLYCDMTTDGGGWTRTLSFEAGDSSGCIIGTATTSTHWVMTIDVAGNWGGGGELMSTFDDSAPAAGPRVSAVKFVPGAFGDIAADFAFPIPGAGWFKSASTDFSLVTLVGNTYPNSVYWDYAAGVLERAYCLGGDDTSAQVCVWPGFDAGHCNAVSHDGTWYTSGVTHELYVRAP